VSWFGRAHAGLVAGQPLAQVLAHGAVGPQRVQVGRRRGVQEQSRAQLDPALLVGPALQLRCTGNVLSSFMPSNSKYGAESRLQPGQAGANRVR